MRNRSNATTATDFPAAKRTSDPHTRLVQPAPGPETPETRDKAGAQSGMVIMLVGAGLFWLAVAAVVVYGLR